MKIASTEISIIIVAKKQETDSPFIDENSNLK
jgi:hypothetical protein